MITKANFTKIIIIVFFSTVSLVSCESHEQEADAAIELVRKERMATNDSNVTKKAEQVKKNETLDEWTLFKIGIENKIRVNEIKIKTLKSTPNASVKFLKQVTRLEKDNYDLRKKMDDYYEEGKTRWEKFKSKMNQDIEDINKEFTDLSGKKP